MWYSASGEWTFRESLFWSYVHVGVCKHVWICATVLTLKLQDAEEKMSETDMTILELLQIFWMPQSNFYSPDTESNSRSKSSSLFSPHFFLTIFIYLFLLTIHCNTVSSGLWRIKKQITNNNNNKIKQTNKQTKNTIIKSRACIQLYKIQSLLI